MDLNKMDLFWGIYSLALTTVFIIALAITLYIFIIKGTDIKNFKSRLDNKMNKLTPTSKFLLWSAVIVICIGLWMPFILTFSAKTTSLDFTETGAIGDTFGGIVNPFIAIAATIVTGLAFYAQFQANLKVNDQFEKQEKQYQNDQFEKLFFEQLKLHKDNVNETSINVFAPDYRTEYGRLIFLFWTKEIQYLMTFLTFICNSLKRRNEIEIFDLFRFSYFVFYKGQFHLTSISDLELSKIFNIKHDLIKIFKEQIPLVADAVKQYTEDYYKMGVSTKNTFYYNSYSIRLPRSTSELFKPKDQWLSQYLRHLYYMVKSVVTNENLNYKSKRQYLRILRNQLSNPEQVLIFYNWLGDYGNAWEEKDPERRKNKQGNYFFTDYRLIHNITNDDITKYFKIDKIFDHTYLNNMQYLEGKEANDTMFDFQSKII